MKHRLTPSLVLTTEHPSSRYGIPVLLKRQDGHDADPPYGPSDLLDYSRVLQPAAHHVVRFAAHHPGDQPLQDAARLFCAQWPEGPQVP